MLAEITPELQDQAARLLSDTQWGSILLLSWSAFFTAIGALFFYIVTLNRQHRSDLKQVNADNLLEFEAQVKRIMEIYESAKTTNTESTQALRDATVAVKDLKTAVDTSASESRSCSGNMDRLVVQLQSRPCLKGGGR